MYLIVTSAEDIASMNIRQKLLDLAEWREVGQFDGSAVLEHGHYNMILIQDIHLYWEDIDKAVEKDTGRTYDCFIFASRHKAKSGMRTLTIHPLGNYGNADFGGRSGHVVPAHPRLMTKALLLLREYASDLDFEISFEVTHHGPYLETPTFFIEIGSDESAWPEEEPAKRIARVIMELADSEITDEDEIVIGVGGGHYAPRHTDFAVRMKASVGHMVPNYALEHLDSEMIAQIKEKTGGAGMVYFHKKFTGGAERRRIQALFEEQGISLVKSADLSPRE